MVLKKSNSGLNSGATQRVKRGCFVDRYYKNHSGLLQGTVDVDIQFSTPELSQQVNLCLQEIGEYLEFSTPLFPNNHDGLLLKRFNNFNRKSDHLYQKCSSFSLGKGGNWGLGERITALMNDIDILRKVSKVMDIHFTKYTENMVSSRLRHTPKTLTSAQILKSAETTEQERATLTSMEKESKTRRRQTYHGRGVQRRRPVPEPREDWDNNENREEQNSSHTKPTLTFTLNNPWLIDARTSKLSERTFDYMHDSPHGHKSLNKCKSYRNGQHAPSRYRSFAINEDIEDMENSNLKAKYSQTLPDDTDNVEDEISQSSYTFDIVDFIARQTVTQRNQVDKDKDNSLLSVAEAKDYDKPKHAKGSYTIVERDPCPIELTESYVVIDCTSVSPPTDGDPKGDQSDSISKVLKIVQPIVEIKKETRQEDLGPQGNSIVQDNLQKQLKETVSFRESFISVSAVIPEENNLDVLDSLIKVQEGSIARFTVGTCLPLCFSLSTQNSSTRPYIVAKETNREKGNWLISLQGSSESQNKVFNDKMFQQCQMDHISLDQLVKISRETLDVCMNILDLETRNKTTSGSSVSQVKPEKWDRLFKKTRQEVSIHSTEEAAEKLQFNSEPPIVAKTESKELHISMSEDIDCGVCFSPCSLYGDTEDVSAMMLTSCGHAHCVSCWRDHVYHSIYNGAPKITCMTTNCDTLVDETTLKSLVPANVIKLWQSRLREKFLETNDHVSWCPNGQCGQLAVSTSAPLKTQFGSPLTCTCKQSWCGSCYNEPHWPASCDQVKAYKKLLSKTGNYAEVPTMDASYQVEMKKCPNCKYPIEKFHGCPSMVCRMCWFNFCWSCLKSAATHNVYYCTTNVSVVTYNLTNKLVYDLPINYFLESLQARKDHALFTKNFSWLDKIRLNLELKSHRLWSRKYHSRAVGGNFSDVDAKSVLDLADDALAFIEGAMAQVELFYIIMGFVRHPNTTKTNRLTTAVDTKISRLRFIIDRLNTHIVGKPLVYIGAKRKLIGNLLNTGASTFDEMFTFVPMLQQASKDVETAWVENIDPMKHLRYM